MSGDVGAIASVGAHALTVVTGAYARDTAEILDHFAFDEDAVTEQARTILEDVTVQVIKVGFAGSAENLSAIAAIAAEETVEAVAVVYAEIARLIPVIEKVPPSPSVVTDSALALNKLTPLKSLPPTLVM